MLVHSEAEVRFASDALEGPSGLGGAGRELARLVLMKVSCRALNDSGEKALGSIDISAVQRAATCPGCSNLSQACFPHSPVC